MRKSVFTFTSAALLLGGLTACGTGERAAENRYYEETRPIGYYTSENNPNVNNDRTRRVADRGGNAYRLDDNDGPLVEIMDRSVIYDGRNNTRGNNFLAPTRTRTNDGMLGQRGPNYSRTDSNYHGHLNGLTRTADPSYYNKYQGRLTEQLAERASKVRGVEDVRAIVNGGDIFIAVEPEARANNTQVTRDVRRAVQPLVGQRDCRVVVDQGTYNSVRSIDNDLRDGGYSENRLNRNMRSIFNPITPAR